MSKRALFLLCLAVVSVGQCTHFQRPWEDRSWIAENPNIWSFGVDVWWNLPRLDMSLESLGLEDVAELQLGGEAKADFDEAASSRADAKGNMLRCTQRELSDDAKAFLAGPVAGPILVLLSEFTKAAGCMVYGSGWRGTMDSSLDSLEHSIKDSDDSIRSARLSYEELRFMGLCDAEYAGAGSEHCAEMRDAFLSVDNNLTEGSYGQRPLLQELSSELSYELSHSEPDMSIYLTMMSLVWAEGGIVDSYSSLREKAESSKEDAKARFRSLEGSAQGRRELAQDILKELEAEDLRLISASPAGSRYRKGGTISQMLSDSVQDEKDASLLLEEMRLESRRDFKQGYLATAISGMHAADEAYGSLLEELDMLEGLAMETVSQQERLARQELDESEIYLGAATPNPESVALFSQALEKFEEGAMAASLGEEFTCYSQAAKLARSARATRGLDDALQVSSSLLELEDLIHRAEADGLNVVSEKENLRYLRQLSPFEISPHMDAATESIISKAEARYGHLPEMGQELRSEISLAGPQAQDLLTDLGHHENGLLIGGHIAYPDAIGGLGGLEEAYLLVGEELELYVADMLSNSITAEASLLMGEVHLDEPVTLTLDILASNQHQLGGELVSVTVGIGQSLPFLYSDIVQNKAHVSSLRSDGDALVITYGSFGPFETKHIVLEKELVLAHTLDKEVLGKGLGDGRAIVTTETGFRLDADVPSMGLDAKTLVGGAPSSRPLKAGRHTAVSEALVEDAYVETTRNFKVYDLGLNSRTQYTISILSTVDLEQVPILIDVANDSRVSSIEMVSMSGEKLSDKRQVSATQYAATVKGISEGRECLVAVSYSIENTESYAKDQLMQLDAMNLSDEAQAALDMARLQSASGDHPKALEYIEMARQIAKEDEKERAKSEKKRDELSEKLSLELEELEAALLLTNSTSPFMEKLRSRHSELLKVFEEMGGLEPSEQVLALEKADYKWLGKELDSFKKDSFKEYNNLKERFQAAGNLSTPDAFLHFEAALNDLETGNRLEYAVRVMHALEEVRSLVSAQEISKRQEAGSLLLVFERLESQTAEVLDHYSREMSAAKGTDYSSLFHISEKKVEDAVKDAEDALDGDPRMLAMKLDQLNKTKDRMEQILLSLEGEASAKISLLESLLSEKGADGDKGAGLRGKLASIRRMAENEEYVNALRAGSSLAKELDSEKPEGDGLLVLGLSALAILAALGAYMVKQQAPKKPKKRKLLSFMESDEGNHKEAGGGPTPPDRKPLWEGIRFP